MTPMLQSILNWRNRLARSRYHRRLAERYGHRLVPPSTVRACFDEVARPARLGFSPIRRGLYGRFAGDEIVQLLKIQPLKGLGYTVWWGVSLAWMPHDWASGMHWHKTLNAARLDLYETPHDLFAPSSAGWRAEINWVAEAGYGESHCRETMERMWANLETVLMTWFLATSSLEGVLKKARAQVARVWVGPRHQPDPRLVVAFTLARMGRCREAVEVLQETIGRGQERLEGEGNLWKAMELVGGCRAPVADRLP